MGEQPLGADVEQSIGEGDDGAVRTAVNPARLISVIGQDNDGA